MADRYWVGGTGTWNGTNTANWSASSGGSGGASVPTSADNVFFDNASDSGADYTVTISTAQPNCANLTVSAQDFIFTLAGDQIFNIYGSISINPGVLGRYNPTHSAQWRLSGTGSHTLSVTNASKLNNSSVNFTSSGTYTLSTSVTAGGEVSTTGPCTLALAGFTLSTGAGDFTLSSGATINFGTGGVLYCDTGNRTFTLSGTVSAANGHVWMNTAGIVSLVVGQAPAITINQVTLGTAACQQISLSPSGNTVFNTLIFGGTVAVSRTISIGNNFTATTINFNGASATTNPHNRRTLISGSSRTITSTTLQNVSCLDFYGITFSGVTLTGSSIGDLSGNSGITFTAAKTSYWVGGTGNWVSDAATRWAASSGGAAAVTNFPLPQDTVVIDNSSGAASSTITVDAVYPTTILAAIGVLSASTRTSALTLTSSTSPYIAAVGNWTNGSGLTLSPVGIQFLKNCTITSNGVSFTSAFAILTGVALTTADNLTVSGGMDNSGGTLAIGNNTVTVGSYTQSSGSLTFGSGTLVLTGSGTAFQITTATVTPGTGTIRLTSASAKTFAGGGRTYNILQNGGAGALTISGNNTFTTIQNTVQPTTFTFTSGSTQTVTNFSVSGTSGNLVTINATSSGAATLSKASGTVSVSFCNISRSTATGGATWSALTSNGNVDGGTNTGWNFVAAGNGLFFGSNF